MSAAVGRDPDNTAAGWWSAAAAAAAVLATSALLCEAAGGVVVDTPRCPRMQSEAPMEPDFLFAGEEDWRRWPGSAPERR